MYMYVCVPYDMCFKSKCLEALQSWHVAVAVGASGALRSAVLGLVRCAVGPAALRALGAEAQDVKRRGEMFSFERKRIQFSSVQLNSIQFNSNSIQFNSNFTLNFAFF